jgi:hypothetical protein
MQSLGGLRRMRNALVLVFVGVVAGRSFVPSCASRPAAPPAGATQAVAPRPPVIETERPAARHSPGTSVSPPAPPGAGQPCGEPGCRFFQEPQLAFAKVLESSPRILGIGEAHALAGTEKIEPATRRFTRDFLPLLEGKASDIVVELLIPNPKCKKETAKAREEQKVVTERQATTDQNDYVVLAKAARSFGIRSHALEPTCDDLGRIASAGKEAVAVSLDVITRLSRELLERLYLGNASGNDARMIVAYGGAMHNDSSPRPGREQWSFGPALQKLTGGKYVDVDLIVPEFISDSPAWKSLPWVSAFDANAHPEATTLLAPSTGSFVLVFPRTAGQGAASSPGSPHEPHDRNEQ